MGGEGRGARGEGRVATTNICEPLLNVVIIEQAKWADRLEPKRRAAWYGLCELWAIVDKSPPANRRDPPRSEIHAEQGKPVALVLA